MVSFVHGARPRATIVAVALAACLALTRPSCAQNKAAFLAGADVSFLPYFEQQGTKYCDELGQADFLTIARRNGWNTLRVRLWLEPDADPKNQVSNLKNVTALGKRIKAAGFRFLLDLHYSDSWADPGQQKKPRAWADLPFDQLVQQVHDYSRGVVQHLQQNGASPDIVQVGNEIKYGLLFGSGLDGSGPQPGGGFVERDKGGVERAIRLFAAGARGVRAANQRRSHSQKPLIMLHIPDGQDTGFVRWYFERWNSVARAATPPLYADFDLVGLSYYPAQPWNPKIGYEPWHLKHLVATMLHVATQMKKPVMIVETNWPRRGELRPVPGQPEYAFSPGGQAKFYGDLLRAVREVPNGLGMGVLAWEPADNLNWNSTFDEKGQALPAVRVLGQLQFPAK